jgi:hypothetical protein
MFCLKLQSLTTSQQFAATGIWQFNPNVFEESYFAPCDVTE